MQAIFGIVRHILTVAGGAFIANGTLTDNELNTLVGALVTLMGVVWSVVEKQRRP